MFYQEEKVFSEDWDTRINPVTGEQEQYIPSTISYWPSESKRETPEWVQTLSRIDLSLYSLLEELYGALNSDLKVLAAIGVRTVFDRASELLGVDVALTFAAKLNALKQQGRIGEKEHATLTVLTDAGSAAAHRGWSPTLEQLSTMMAILESFLHKVFILEDAADKLRSSVPAKPSAAKVSGKPEA